MPLLPSRQRPRRTQRLPRGLSHETASHIVVQLQPVNADAQVQNGRNDEKWLSLWGGEMSDKSERRVLVIAAERALTFSKDSAVSLESMMARYSDGSITLSATQSAIDAASQEEEEK